MFIWLEGLFLQTQTSSELLVDTARGGTLHINVSLRFPFWMSTIHICLFLGTKQPNIFSMCGCVQLDVTFPGLACSVVSLDAMDISGEQHLDVVMLLLSFCEINVCKMVVNLFPMLMRRLGML